MEFEWNEAKRQHVLAKHKVDFADALLIFEGLHVILAARSEVEVHEIAVGLLGERMVALVFTRRGDRIRLITARGARENEQREYREIHS